MTTERNGAVPRVDPAEIVDAFMALSAALARLGGVLDRVPPGHVLSVAEHATILALDRDLDRVMDLMLDVRRLARRAEGRVS